MKDGRKRYVQKFQNHAHNVKKLQISGRDHEKSGKDYVYLAGLLEKSSIMRISLISYTDDN